MTANPVFASTVDMHLSRVKDASALEVAPDFIEKLPLAIYACDSAGRILWFNKRAADLWGRTPRIGGDDEKYCGSHKLYFDGRLISRAETPMAKVLRTGVPVRGIEGRVERPDGSSSWAMVHIEPVTAEDGAVVGAINCFHETTALHHEPNDLEDFFENSPVGLHLVSDIGTILRANRAQLAMLGLAPEEYVGRNVREFHVDDATIEDILGRLGRKEPLKHQPARLRAKDGSIRHVLITSNARTARSGEFLNTLCLTIDVTDRVRSDELLREQDQRLRVTYDHAGSGIVEADADGKLLRVNARLCEMMGRTADELVGRSIFDETVSEDVAEDFKQFRSQVSGEIDRYTIEKRIPRKDGGFFWASVTSSSIRDANGRFLYAVRVQNDISERKKVEKELALRVEEQAALHEFTRSLQDALSLGDLYGPALDAIQRALRCQRASILLFDKAGVMRFVAWRGLSDGYRAAVEGHSPWSPDADDPDPICFAAIDEADLPDALSRTIKEEGIEATAFIPIQEGGRLLGKFMAYYDQVHSFTDREIELARTIADQLGFSIERVRARKATQQLISIVESSHDAIVSKDLDGIVMTWNEGAEHLFGYTAEEMVGKPITAIIPLDRLDEEPEILRHIRNGEVDRYETIRRRKDGSLIDVSLTISPVRDAKGRIVGASKIARDITDRKETEARIKASEQRLQDLLAAIPAAIYTTDADGTITYFNQAAVDLAGRTPTLGLDRWCVTWKLYWPDGTPLPHEECPMAVTLKEGRPVRGMEAVAERPDGTRVPFIPYPTPIRNEDGEIVGAINMLVDVSERKEAETQQHVLLNELNHRVKNNMQMLQSLLFTSARQSSNGEARRILQLASGRVSAMAAAQRVLYDTMQAARFSGPQFINAVCQTVGQTLSPPVSVSCDAVPCELSNDSAMPLALILNELMTNAAKYGANGESGRAIRVGLLREEDAYILFVEDQGPGFDLAKVRQKSSGLRLVEGLARQLGGKFTVGSDGGTRCCVTFPAVSGGAG